jgi:hypothetical protein
MPTLTPEECAAFARACLADLARRLASFPAHRFVAIPPDASAAALRAIVGDDWDFLDQGGGELGTRLAFASGAAFRLGHAPVAVLGADHPHVSLDALALAMEAAGRGDAGWITAHDGGFACLALPRELPELFAHIPWSTAGVADATRNNARDLGVTLVHAGTGYDLDSAADVDRFLGEPTSAETCPGTWRMLAALAPSWAERRPARG